MYWILYETTDGKDEVLFPFENIDEFLNRLMSNRKYIENSVAIWFEPEESMSGGGGEL